MASHHSSHSSSQHAPSGFGTYHPNPASSSAQPSAPPAPAAPAWAYSPSEKAKPASSAHLAHEATAAPVTPFGHVQVAPVRLEPQPFIKDWWRWLADNTTGVARVDLRRPIPPYAEQYRGNLLFASYKGPHHHLQPGNLGFGSNRSNGNGRPASPYYQPPAGSPYYTAAGSATSTGTYPEPAGAVQGQSQAVQRRGPTGARIKITRSFVFGRDENNSKAKPMVDLGGGVNVDMDQQRVDPVFRLKIKDWLSIKAFPQPLLKISKNLPLGRTGMGIKVHYEVPLEHIGSFYQPPSRLMVRLEHAPGSGFGGIHVTPTGIEFDQTSLRFGRNIQLRASAAVLFPRSLPIDPENDDFGLKLHRLSLKTLW